MLLHNDAALKPSARMLKTESTTPLYLEPSGRWRASGGTGRLEGTSLEEGTEGGVALCVERSRSNDGEAGGLGVNEDAVWKSKPQLEQCRVYGE
jgi:hypothetical protein